MLTTYKDLVDHVLDYLGADVSVENRRAARRAVQSAYRQVATEHRWRYLVQSGRLNTVAPYSTGTITYDHTGSTFERELTLASGTWPTWAALGVVVIDNVPYTVATRESGTVLTLSLSSNPGADVAAGTEYSIYQDTYLLPCDWQESAEVTIANQIRCLSHVSVGEWAQLLRNHWLPATPYYYCFTGNDNYMGGMAMKFFPAPDQIYPLNYMYKRLPRPLNVEIYDTGKITTTASSAAITGTGGAAWTSALIGSILRISANATDEPTGPTGGTLALYERTIIAVGSATTLTLDSTVDQTLTGVKYTISDPADIDTASMLTLLLRECEKQARVLKRMKTDPMELREYSDAKMDAWAVDSRSWEAKAAGMVVDGRMRLADMPYSAG